MSSATAAAPTGPKDLVVCPYTADEIHAAIGMRVRLQPAPVNELYGMHHATCRAVGDGSNGYVTITQTLAPAATAARRFDAILRTELKGSVPLPGDPDGARWLANAELNSSTLAYVRGTVLTRVTVAGADKELVAGLKDNLLKLKRVP